MKEQEPKNKVSTITMTKPTKGVSPRSPSSPGILPENIVYTFSVFFLKIVLYFLIVGRTGFHINSAFLLKGTDALRFGSH